MKGDFKLFFLSVFTLAQLFLSACKDSTVEPLVENNYPLTIHSVSDSVYEKLQTEFDQLNNNEIHTYLNKYGYTGIIKDLLAPETNVYLTKEKAIEIACKTLVINRKFTNVNDYNAIISNTESADTAKGYNNSEWRIQFGLQNYKGYNVLFANIVVFIIAGKVFQIYGSWYPDPYVPLKDIMTPDSARKNVVGIKIYKHGAPIWDPFLVVTDSMIGRISNKVIVPMIKENLIEMRVAWEIPLVDDAFHVYLDTTTGEIVQITQKE